MPKARSTLAPCAARSRCRGSGSPTPTMPLRRRAPASRSSGRCDIDLHVPPGQTLALVGTTGAGKSTFAKLVARFYDPQRGKVLVDGHDLTGVQQHALRRQLGIVPQEGFLFSGSVRENIAFGRPEASLEEVEAAAAAV